MEDIANEDAEGFRRKELAFLNRPENQRNVILRPHPKSTGSSAYDDRQYRDHNYDDSSRRSQRRRQSSSLSSSSDYSEPTSRRRKSDRRERNDRHRRALSETRPPGSRASEGTSSRLRSDFDRNIDKNFDRSFDGAIAAAAGAGIGAIAARKYGEKDKKGRAGHKESGWKTLGGALAGAAAANAAGKQWRGHVDDKAEGKR